MAGVRPTAADAARPAFPALRLRWPDPAAARLRQRTAAAWSPWLILVGGLCVGLPVLAAALSGNLTIPHNDAWSMSRIAQTFATTGHIHLLNWNDMNLIGQVVALGPLGSSLVVQQLAVAALSLLCLLCAYRLLALSLGTRSAVAGTLLLGLWPGWASLSTSFETDIPTLAATFAALLLGRRALVRDSIGWLAAALVVSLWAISIREQAIVAPATFLAYGWFTRRSRRRLGARNLVLAAIAAAAAIIGFEIWRWALPLGQNPAVTAGLPRFLGNTIGCASRTYFTLALVLSPAVLLGAARHRWSRRDRPAIIAGIILVALAWGYGGVVGRYLDPSGEYAQVLPGTRVVIPPALWGVLLSLGCVSGALLVPLVRKSWRSVDPLLGLFTVLAYAEIVVIGAAGNWVFDRYLPVLVPGTLAAILARTRDQSEAGAGRREVLAVVRRRVRSVRLLRALAGGALACVGVTSALLAANGYAFDAARWHAAQRLAREGVPAERIAAGLEWIGWHSPDGMIYSDRKASQPGGWQLAFYRSPACIVLTPSPLGAAAHSGEEAAWTPAGFYTYRTFLVAGRSRLFVYRTHARGCVR